MACSAPEPGPPGNIILITIDTLRADHLSAYGHANQTSPRIDAFFADGTRFDSAVSASPCTLPSVRQLLTGKIAPDLADLRITEILRAKGYQTAAIVSQHFFRENGRIAPEYARGFDDFDIQGPRQLNRYRMTDRKATEVTDRALEWLENRGREAPFFLWLHYFDPHDPYLAPMEHRVFEPRTSDTVTGDRRHWLLRAGVADLAWERSGHVFSPEQVEFFRAQYDAEIHYVDSQIGRIFDGLADHGLVERSLVVLTSDHGERLGEDDWWDHCQSLHQRELWVPLLVRRDGGPLAGEAVSGVAASTLDIFPTILEVAGIPMRGALAGGSLVSASADRIVRTAWQEHRAALLAPWKLERSPDGATHLYDVAKDPQQSRDRRAEKPEIARLLSDSLDASEAELDRAGSHSETILERLRAIGYIQ